MQVKPTLDISNFQKFHLSVLIPHTVLGEGFVFSFVCFLQESCTNSRKPTLEMYRQATPLEPTLAAHTIPSAARKRFSVS